jgi:polysaccharide chain length determinant protein (PEP-CTERM system associated)
MHELFLQLMDQARGVWRFRWIALAVAWLVCLIGWVGILFVPDTFEASARVFVDTRTTLSQVTQGITVDSNVETQLQRVRQALLGGPALEKVAAEAGLVPRSATPQQRQGLLSRLRERTTITGTLSRESASSGLYVISYQDANRNRSLRVVDRLLSNFVQSALGGKREGSQQAQRFLTDQIADYERRLSGAESKLADFKKQNIGVMPGAQGDYFTRLQAEMDASNKVQASLAIALRRRNELGRQIRGEQPVITSGQGTFNSGTSPVPGNDTATRIREAQAHLDELLLRFTEKHPDVIALRQTLADLHARQDAEIEAMKRGDPGAAARLGLATNPVYQSIQLQLNQSEVEIAALRAEIADHQRKTADLRNMVNSAPEVEAELARLNRDYDVTRAQYNALVDRLQRAKLSDEADQTGFVRFEVIDPPSAAFVPVAPDRPKVMLMTLLFGLAAGIGIAYLLHQLRPVFTTSRQLAEITNLPVLGVVSMTWLERHRSLARRGVYAYSGIAALLLALSVVMVAGQGEATRLAQSLIQ